MNQVLKHIFLIGFSLVSISLSAAVETGTLAPDFTLLDSTGKEHSLSDFEDSYVVLEWTNHQCPFVKKFYTNGNMQLLQKEMTEKGVVWLQVLSSAEGKQGFLIASEAESLRKQQGVNSTALLLDTEGKVGHQYGARTTPHMFLINPEGLIIYQGAIDSIKSTDPEDIENATNYVKSAYESAVAGKPVDPATTTPYGCSVKY
jgi:peroxiredoxin